MTDLLPPDAPIFRGIICTDCGFEFDAARLLVLEWSDGGRSFFCPRCQSSELDWALKPVKTRSAVFHHGEARLPDGWVMRRGRLDETGTDAHGWVWGQGDPVFILTPGDTDDSLSVRAPCPVIAVALVSIDGWPPRKSKRFNWEYHSP